MWALLYRARKRLEVVIELDAGPRDREGGRHHAARPLSEELTGGHG
jgi:hypothetical protein